MFVIFIRTVITFILLEIVVRLLGKRHMGELEIGEFITTLMISEIATLPLQDASIPLLYAVVPISVLMFFEIGSSMILTKIPKLKALVAAEPSFLIEKGKINQSEMKRLRISAEELLSALRQNNVSSVEDVNYAIMEQNADITVIPKATASSQECNTASENYDRGIPHIIISNGKLNEKNIIKLNKNTDWINIELQKKGLSSSNIFLMTVDDCDNVYISEKEEK